MNIPIGFCQCGCGLKTAIPKRNDSKKGWVKGVPIKWVRNHHVVSKGKQSTQRSIGNKGMSSHGYVRVLVENGIRRYEHILIAEKVLDRPLKNFGLGNPKTEVVHHLNGIKHDNRPSNLLICSHKYHTELHHRLEVSSDWPEFQKINRKPSKGG